MADLKNKLSYGSKGTVASSNETGGVEITTPEIRTETDPRSTILTNQDSPTNKIGIGDQVEVRGTRRMLKSKSKKATWYQVMWLSAIKLAVSAGSKIYANKQKAKVAMSDAQLLHAERQARGEEAYQGKLLEARQNDYKDEFVLLILSAPIVVLAWGVFSDDPGALEKVKTFFEHFAALPTWFSTLWILVVGSIFGIKGTQIFKNGGKK